MNRVFLTIAATLLGSQLASANLFDNYSLDPTPGKVESIHSFTLKFPDTNGYTGLEFGKKAQLVLPDKSVVENGNWQQVMQGITFEFAETYTAEGVYTLKIPAGWFSQNGDSNPAISVEYTIEAGSVVPDVPDMPADFKNGIIMLNEDWFGHTSSSMNFLANDGEIYYNVYRGANADRCLGNTLQYGQVFGDFIFVMSKQSYTEDGRAGGRFIAMDANTLEFKHEFTSLPGGDGRGVCAANAHKAYVGTSKGFYALNLDTWELSDKQLAPTDSPKQSGDMIRMGKYVFVAQQNLGVVAVDPVDDSVTLLDFPKVAGFVVMADGTLYAACSDANGEFVKIDPWTLETEVIDIEGSHGIASPWGTWRPAQICADKVKNRVYYVSSGGWTVSSASAYDFDTKEFTDKYITVPTNQQIYGQISTDPSTGYVMVTACQNGYGANYEHNWVYFFDTNTGAFDDTKTIKLEQYYWFPAMMLYPDYDAPEVSVSAIDMEEGRSVSVDLAEATSLRVGNKHLVNYSAQIAERGNVCEAAVADGKLTVNAVGEGDAKVLLTAEYQGRANTVEIPVTVSALNGVESVGEEAAGQDVYTLTGVRVLRAATADQIKSLERGLYVIGGKKVAVK